MTKAKFVAAWTEALAEFALSRERIRRYELEIEASQARTRANLGQIDMFMAQWDLVDQQSENERHAREKMALRLENQLLRFERRLP